MSALYTCDREDCTNNMKAEEVNKAFVGYFRSNAEIEQLAAANPSKTKEALAEEFKMLKVLDLCNDHMAEFKKQF